jgi:hypothetical protein
VLERLRLREASLVRRSVGPAVSQWEPARQAEFGLELAQLPAALRLEQVTFQAPSVESGLPVVRQGLHSVEPAARRGPQVPGAAVVRPREARRPVPHAGELLLAARAAAVGQPAAARDVAAALPRAEALAPDVLERRRAASGAPVQRQEGEESGATVEPEVLGAPHVAAEPAASDAQVLRPEEAPEVEPWEASAEGPWDDQVRPQAEPPLLEAALPSAEAPYAPPFSLRLAARRRSAPTAHAMQSL